MTVSRGDSTTMEKWKRDVESRAEALRRGDDLMERGLISEVLWELIDVPVIVVDRDYLVLWFNSFANEYIERIWDRKLERGDHLLWYSMPEVIDAVKVSLSAAFNGEPQTKTREVVFPSGHRVWFTVRYIPIVLDGEVEAVAFVTNDISREASAKREKEAFYRALNLLEVGVTIVEAEGNYALKFVNDGFCKMTGHSREELLGRNTRFLQDDIEQGRELERLRAILSAHGAGTVTLRNRRADGSIFLNRLTVNPLFNEKGELVEYLGLQTDITDEVSMRRGLERAQRMESLGQLAAGMAHDFNNILQVILQSAQLSLEETQESNAARSDLAVIEKSAKHARELVGDLLSFARAKPTKRGAVDLVELVESAAPLFRSLMRDNGEFHVDLPSSPLVVWANRSELERVLLNLVTNARDATDEHGRVDLHVTYASDSEGHPVASLIVTDNGVGMSEETQERAFEPFYTTKGVDGTGLGLSTTSRIISELGGSIDLKSSPGEGTRIEILLPLDAGDADI